jgi:hypothetical protein
MSLLDDSLIGGIQSYHGRRWRDFAKDYVLINRDANLWEGKMKLFSILFFVLVAASVCDAENIILSAATTDKKLILLNVEYANKKYTVVDSAIFDVPFQAGVTGLIPVENGNYLVFWTAQDASKKIKLHKMVIDADLNKVGNTKKFGRVLTSYSNLELIEADPSLNSSGTQTPQAENPSIALDAVKEWVRFAVRTPDGNLIEEPRRIYKSPTDFDAFDSDVCFSDDGNFYYASLGYFPSTQRYGVVFGNLANTNFTSAFLFTGGPIISEDLIPVYEKDEFNFIHVQRSSNPTRYKIANRQFFGSTGQPDGALINLVSINSGDLGQLAFFNMVTAVPSSEEPTGGHVFYIQLNASKTGTDLKAFHMNTVTGKRNSAFADLGLQQIYDAYIYGLDVKRAVGIFD